jgi:hypothetical protein
MVTHPLPEIGVFLVGFEVEQDEHEFAHFSGLRDSDRESNE